MQITEIPTFSSLEQLKIHLTTLDPETDLLFFKDFSLNLTGMQFSYMDCKYQIEDVLLEDNEIPLLGVLRADIASQELESLEWDEHLRMCDSGESGYYTVDERPYTDLQSDFSNHTNWNFTPGGRYSWQVPGIENGTLIGFYWLPLTAVINDLNKN